MLDIQHITMYYDDLKSLDDITFSVNDGSIFGLIGSNGSGKSTLLRLFAGILSPKEGQIKWNGQPIYENIPVKESIVYLSDEQYFIPHATVRDMRKLYESVYPDFSLETYTKLRTLFDLDENRKISTFSKGMKKQTSVMLGIASRPKLLLCDETFDGLDPVVRQAVKRVLIEQSAENGTTTIIASHNLREMEDICDTIALLHRGKLLFERELDDMKLTLHKVQAVFHEEIDKERLSPLPILSFEKRGNLVTFVARAEESEINRVLSQLSPVYSENVPLTLEEIFINEMEEIGYDVGNILA